MGQAKDIQSALRAIGNPEIAAHSSRFFKSGPGEYAEGDRFLGVRVPEVRALIRQHRQIRLHELRTLIRSKWHEERLFAVLWLNEHCKRAGPEDLQTSFEFYLREREHVNNWDLVDGSAPGIVGRWLFPRDRSMLYDFVRAESLWDRRIAILSTLHFIKAGDLDDTFALSALLLDDNQDLMHKAAGWMLREAGKRDRARLDDFLGAKLNDMPRTMLRYAIEKHPEAERQAWLRGS
ncbi:MAG: DNA alkylation repair protein [Pseudomonadota bacterium]